MHGMAPLVSFRNLCLLVGLCLSAQLDAQQRADSPYQNLKKLTVCQEQQLVNPVFRIGTANWFRENTPVRPLFSFEMLPALSLSPKLTLLRWSAEDLPFFCRIEHNLGLKTQVPIKFRLGSVEYVDWLEGKRK